MRGTCACVRLSIRINADLVSNAEAPAGDDGAVMTNAAAGAKAGGGSGWFRWQVQWQRRNNRVQASTTRRSDSSPEWILRQHRTRVLQLQSRPLAGAGP